RRASRVPLRRRMRAWALPRSLRTLSRLWQSTQAVLLAAAAAGEWGFGWGSPNLSRGRACRPKTGEAKCEHYLLLPLSPWEWVRWAHRTRLPARPMAQPLRRRLTKRARLSQWLAVAGAAGTAARAAGAGPIGNNKPPNAHVPYPGSRAARLRG